VTDPPERKYWRVGYHLDPAGFVPWELCSWNHRYDDLLQRFRTIYIAEQDQTAIREVLADLRPNAGAIARYVKRFGPASVKDIPSQPVTQSWRRQHVLAQVHLEWDGLLLDLCDPDIRYELEVSLAPFLHTYEMDHLDLSEITARLRPLTQLIATLSYDADVAGVRFPSRLDGQPCVAVFEGRGSVEIIGDPAALIDPPPEALQEVCSGWHLLLEPASGV
jgi:RES domain